MRKFVALLTSCCFLPLTMQGQAAPAGSSWTRVQQLPPHTKLHVSADSKSRTCNIEAVDPDKLTCSGSIHGHYTFSREEVKSIHIAHYYRSTAAGAGIGAVAGAVTGVALNSGKCSFICFSSGEVAAVVALIFAVPGALIGAGTDFTRGSSIYTRP